MNLWQDFQINNGKIIWKWHHYFPIYERHFSNWRNKTIVFWEIGVNTGGSLQMWSRYFGPLATVVGIDINPLCKEHEGDGIHVRIGDQSDHTFLESVINEFGVPDIILDDGSHQMNHIMSSFEYLYPKLPKNGIYMVEDLHTAYSPSYGGGIDNPNTFTNISKNFIDGLNAFHSESIVQPDYITKHTFAMSFYDSIIVFERGTIPYKKASQIGKAETS